MKSWIRAIYSCIYIYISETSRLLTTTDTWRGSKKHWNNHKYNRGNHKSKSKVLQYAFSEVMMVTNHTGLWDTKFAWYSPNATCQDLHIWLRAVSESSFRPTWPCWIVKVLPILTKCFQSFDQLQLINVFGYFCSVMVQFRVIKQRGMSSWFNG